MTAIHLPPGSPSGQNLDSNTLRAQVSANKLAALLPTAGAGGTGVRQSTGTATQAADAATLGNAPARAPAAAPGGSTRETFSFAARTILALLDPGEAAQPLRTGAPLLAAPPSTLPQGAAQARQALASLVQHSGLFYESHLAQWVAGERGLVTLIREPQARIGRQSFGAMGAGDAQHGAGVDDGAGAYGSTQSRHAAAAGVGGRPALPPASLPTSSTQMAAVVAAADAAVASTLADAGGERTPADAEPTDPSDPADPVDLPSAARHGEIASRPGDTGRAQLAAAQAYRAAADEASQTGTTRATALASGTIDPLPESKAAATDNAAAPLHPDTEPIVRQQLELLATQQFRWAGEAWPGTPMQWEISEQRAEDGEAGNEAAAAEQRNWTSRLVLDLPQLGQVEARLTLTPSGLEARLAVQDSKTAERLTEAQATLRQSLDARGIELLQLSIARDGDSGEAA